MRTCEVREVAHGEGGLFAVWIFRGEADKSEACEVYAGAREEIEKE